MMAAYQIHLDGVPYSAGELPDTDPFLSRTVGAWGEGKEPLLGVYCSPVNYQTRQEAQANIDQGGQFFRGAVVVEVQ